MSAPRITEIEIQNIGTLELVRLPITQPLILLYGSIKQGKTTILRCVQWAFGGEFPEDILRHGFSSGHVQLTTEDGFIRREFYVGDDGSTKARPLIVSVNGERVKKPVDYLKKFCNPFLLDQDHLEKMLPAKRKQFFVELFGFSMADLDAELAKLTASAEQLRATLNGYANIDLTPFERVDPAAILEQLSSLRTEAASIREDNERRVNAHKETLAFYRQTQGFLQQWTTAVGDREKELRVAQARLEEAQKQVLEIGEWLARNPQPEAPVQKLPPDPRPLEQKLLEAGQQNARAEQYQRNMARAKERDGLQSKLAEVEGAQRKVKLDRLARLQSLNDNLGVPGLEFAEDGTCLFEGTAEGMLSTAQRMTLAKRLGALYPEGLNLELVDRAESLGASIFEFIEEAKAKNKTILATIVGDRPAVVPAEVGVFVVEKGALSA